MLPITKASLWSCCGTCLKEFHTSPTNKEETYDVENTENLTKWLNNTCWPIEMTVNDAYPKRICNICYMKVQAFYKFREKTNCSVVALTELLEENLTESTVRNLQKFCRTCLKKLKSTDGLSNVSETPNVNEWLQMCTGFNTNDTPYDKFPRFLCALCFQKLKNFVKFREITKESFECFSNILNSSNNEEYRLEKKSTRISSQCETLTMTDSIRNDVQNEFIPSINDIMDKEEVALELSNVNTMPSNVFAEKLPLLAKSSEIAKNQKSQNNYTFNHQDFLMNINDYETEDVFPELQITTYGSNTRTGLTGSHNLLETNELYLEKKIPVDWTESSNVQYEKFDKPRKKTRKKNLILNQKGNSNPSSKRIDCELCGKKFFKRVLYEAHVKGIHEGHDKPFRCEICVTSFRLYSYLKRHIKEIHLAKHEFNHSVKDIVVSERLIGNLHQCKFCSKMFKRKEHLKDHQNSVHLGIRPFKCRSCEKSFATRRTCRIHEMGHTGERPYTCGQCNKSFRQKSELKIHMEIHTENGGLLCPICKRVKSSKQELDTHIKKHSQQYQCSMCGKIFKKKSHLTDHEKAVHFKIRPFKCSYCDLTFSLAKTCKVHERVHTGDRPEVCLICGKSFKQRNVMLKHFKSHKLNVGTNNNR